MAILISILSFGAAGIYSIRVETNRMSAESLHLICENKKGDLDDYLNSIKQSVNIISRYSTDSLDKIDLVRGGVIGAKGYTLEEIPGRRESQRRQMDAYIDRHLELIHNTFQSMASHTNGAAAYYYRINPEITTEDKGFPVLPLRDFRISEAGAYGSYRL